MKIEKFFCHCSYSEQMDIYSTFGKNKESFKEKLSEDIATSK